uniref:G-protein coupled receptors family 1 profile domain-containing protein n=1 Tax=Pyxicephalus adspersus TaxID=30357 RepID=A0AAV3B4C5_PYXAD|nr:TPA: hypothetical protein GDO54_005785 [Pyxicephalus adspersus]
MHQFVITRRTIYEFPNRTHVSVFEFSGLSDEKECVLFLFIFFLLVYMVTIVGNLGIIALVFAFSSLHTPMKSISFFGCALQLYFFSALASTETLLLSTMSYDRYVAICHPLHYTLIMTKKKCFGLILLCYSLCFMQSFVHTCCVFSLPFCGPNLIDHFYCDIPPLLKLSCSSPFHCTMVTGILVVACGIYTFIAISLSYAFIFLSIFRMTSSNGRRKAFSTCSSHIICVSTFFTTVFFVYLRPHSGVFRIQDKMASVFYTTVTPMLNPLIYSLRNQEVKQILIQVIRRSLNRTPP